MNDSRNVLIGVLVLLCVIVVIIVSFIVLLSVSYVQKNNTSQTSIKSIARAVSKKTVAELPPPIAINPLTDIHPPSSSEFIAKKSEITDQSQIVTQPLYAAPKQKDIIHMSAKNDRFDPLIAVGDTFTLPLKKTLVSTSLKSQQVPDKTLITKGYLRFLNGSGADYHLGLLIIHIVYYEQENKFILIIPQSYIQEWMDRDFLNPDLSLKHDCLISAGIEV